MFTALHIGLISICTIPDTKMNVYMRSDLEALLTSECLQENLTLKQQEYFYIQKMKFHFDSKLQFPNGFCLTVNCTINDKFPPNFRYLW